GYVSTSRPTLTLERIPTEGVDAQDVSLLSFQLRPAGRFLAHRTGSRTSVSPCHKPNWRPLAIRLKQGVSTGYSLAVNKPPHDSAWLRSSEIEGVPRSAFRKSAPTTQ